MTVWCSAPLGITMRVGFLPGARTALRGSGRLRMARQSVPPSSMMTRLVERALVLTIVGFSPGVEAKYSFGSQRMEHQSAFPLSRSVALSREQASVTTGTGFSPGVRMIRPDYGALA